MSGAPSVTPQRSRYSLCVTSVDWPRISEKQYEDMVSVLLSHLYPESTRIDGSGGDGGRDVQIVTSDGIEGFELKSFTGRMTSARRRQVKNSLLKVKELNPKSWTLIVALNFTTAESEWFARLRKLVPFPIDSKGKTWLDARFAERTYIVRYFLEDAANEVVRLAEILNQEKAVLAGGAPDALERAGAIVQQLNSLDPFYTYELTVSETVRKVAVIPRYQGALIDQPIGGAFRFRFPKDEAGIAAAEAFERALDFGTGATVPADYVEELRLDLPAQLGGALEKPELRLEPTEVDTETTTFILACTAPDGRTLAELPLELRCINRGRRGSIWRGGDRTGSLSVELTADTRERRFQTKLAVRSGLSYYPQDMWPVVRFLVGFTKPNRVEVRTDSGQRLTELVDAPDEAWIAEFMPKFIEDLVLVQAAAGMTRKVPGEVSREDLEGIGAAAALLRGESIDVSWDRLVFTVSGNPTGGEEHSFFDPEIPLILVTQEPHKVTFAGVDYPLGKRARVDYLARLGGVPRRVGELIEVDPVPGGWARRGIVPPGSEVVLVPASTNAAKVSLVSESAQFASGEDVEIGDMPGESSASS